MPTKKSLSKTKSKTRQIDLLTIGDCSIDIYMTVDSDFVLPERGKESPQICFLHGSKVPVESFSTAIAGNACNIAVGCKHLGLNTTVYTELGDDENAETFIREFKKRGIKANYCLRNKQSPTNIHTVVIAGGERTIFSYHEKRNYKLYPWETPKWIYYSSLAKGFEKFQMELIRYLKLNTNIGVAFNPGTMQLRAGLENIKNFLAVTDILFVNKEEAAMLVQDWELEVMHKKLMALGPKLTVITNGKRGSSVFDGKNILSLGLYKSNEPVIDRTGVGDGYASGFLSAIFYGKSLVEAMRWGTVNAQGVTRKVGAINGLRDKKDIERILRSGAVFERSVQDGSLVRDLISEQIL